jgi:hypothetical protein
MITKLDDTIDALGKEAPTLARQQTEVNQPLLNRSYSPLDCALNGFRYEAIDSDTGKLVVMNESGLRVSVDNGNDTA